MEMVPQFWPHSVTECWAFLVRLSAAGSATTEASPRRLIDAMRSFPFTRESDVRTDGRSFVLSVSLWRPQDEIFDNFSTAKSLLNRVSFSELDAPTILKRIRRESPLALTVFCTFFEWSASLSTKNSAFLALRSSHSNL